MAAVAVFAAGVIVSLATSWVLVSRIERLGERLGLSEALLGIVAALAADTPEITAAVTAVTGHQQNVGAGVVLGSNVFNLAALLGLGAVVAGRLALHRKVVALGGVVAMWVAVVCVAVVAEVLPVVAGLVLTVTVLLLYMVLLGTEGLGLERVRLPQRWRAWLRSAVTEEEIELEDAIRPARGRWPDAATAAGALLAVIVSSVVMERAASDLGQRYGIPQIITGGLVLAAVTSLPNAVAAVYLAGRGRGAASLSIALNSNTINVIAGLLLPAALIGLHRPSGQAQLVTVWYAGLSLAVLALAYRLRGLSRVAGILIIAVYAAFVTSVVVSGYALAHAPVVITGLSVLSAVVLAAGLVPFVKPRHSRRPRPRPGPAEPACQLPGAGQLEAWPARDRLPPGILAAGRGQSVSAFGGGSLIPGWSAVRIWTLSLLLPAFIAAIDGAAGRHIILIGLLIAGPCCALLTARWLLTALTGILAAGLAVVLGIPDGIWATSTHLTFIGSVVVVATSCTCAAALITKASPERRILRLPVYAMPESRHRMPAYGAASAGAARRKLLGVALRLATISVVFGLLSGTVSIIAGLGDHSLGVFAVGLGVLADVSGSAVLIWRFRAERRRPGNFGAVESRAAITIAIALALVAVVLVVQSAAALAERSHPGTSPVALAVAGVSFLALAPLAYAKRRLGRRMASRALQGDGTLSAIGAATSLLALIALALYDALGWWWADRVAALVVAAIAVTEAWRTIPRREPHH